MKNIGKDRKEQGYRRLIISKEVYRQMYPLDRIAYDEAVYIYVNPFNKQVEVDIKSNWWGKITHKVLKKPLKEKKRYLWDKKDYDRLIAEEKKTLLYQVYKKRNMKIANTQGIESNIIISCKCGNEVLAGEPLDLFESLTGNGCRYEDTIIGCIKFYCSECEKEIVYEELEEGSKEVIHRLLGFFLR